MYNAFYQCYQLSEVYNLSGLELDLGSKANGFIGYYARYIYLSMDAVRDFITVEDKYEFYYDSESDIYILEYYYGDDTELILPEYVNGKEYAIDDYAFKNIITLEKVIIPSTVVRIGEGVFNGCENISELELSYIGESAFCTEASENTLIGYLFGKQEYNNSQLVNQFTLNPEKTTGYYLPLCLHSVVLHEGNILDGAFSNLTTLDSITFLGEIQNIGSYAFYNTSIKEIDLPDNVQNIGDYAFGEVEELITLYLNANISEIGVNAFEFNRDRIVYYNGTIESWCNIVFKSRKSNPIDDSLIYMKDSNDEWNGVINMEIPDTITEIGDYQFAGIKGDAKFIFSSSIEKIGQYAFCDAGGGYAFWGELDLSNTKITTIGKHALAGTEMKSITMPNTVTAIEREAFSDNRFLENIKFSSNIESIGYGAFSKCIRLEELILPESVKKLDACVFSRCNALKNIYVPSSVTEMGASLFEGCTSLESLHLPFIGNVEPKHSDPFNQYDESECNMLGYYFNTYPEDGMVECVQQMINSDMIGTGSDEFIYAEYTFYIPKTLKKLTIDRGELKNGALNNCTMLEEIIHNGQDYYRFDYNSLCGCSALKSLTLTNKITEFRYDALKGCSIDVINYRGSEKEWFQIPMYNAPLLETTIVYNYVD